MVAGAMDRHCAICVLGCKHGTLTQHRLAGTLVRCTLTSVPPCRWCGAMPLVRRSTAPLPCWRAATLLAPLLLTPLARWHAVGALVRRRPAGTARHRWRRAAPQATEGIL